MHTPNYCLSIVKLVTSPTLYFIFSWCRNLRVSPSPELACVHPLYSDCHRLWRSDRWRVRQQRTFRGLLHQRSLLILTLAHTTQQRNPCELLLDLWHIVAYYHCHLIDGPYSAAEPLIPDHFKSLMLLVFAGLEAEKRPIPITLLLVLIWGHFDLCSAPPL